MTVRLGEADKGWFRSERYLHVNDLWYFTTREMTEEGPYMTKQDAEMELMLYIRHMNDSLHQHNA